MKRIHVIHLRVVRTLYAQKRIRLEPVHVRRDTLVIHIWVVVLNVSQTTTVLLTKHVPIINV